MTAFRDRIQGALVLAPMTKGSNLPYRRLCQELGYRLRYPSYREGFAASLTEERGLV